MKFPTAVQDNCSSDRLVSILSQSVGVVGDFWLNSNKGTKCDTASSPNPFCTLRFVSLD